MVVFIFTTLYKHLHYQVPQNFKLTKQFLWIAPAPQCLEKLTYCVSGFAFQAYYLNTSIQSVASHS